MRWLCLPLVTLSFMLSGAQVTAQRPPPKCSGHSQRGEGQARRHPPNDDS
jgi:hypothetical protein